MSQPSRAEISENYDEKDHDHTYVITESEEESGSDHDDSHFVAFTEEYTQIRITESGHLYLADEGVMSKLFSRPFLLKHEIPRKVFHSSQGFIALYLYVAGFKQPHVAQAFWVLFAVTAMFEVLRLNCPPINRLAYRFVKDIIRKEEYDSCNGIVFFLAGVALNLSFASKDIATVSTLLLSWADTAASTVGRAYGKYTPQVSKGKSLAGCLASAATGYVVCLVFYGYIVPKHESVSDMGDILWTPESSTMGLQTFALAMGLATSVSEAINLPGLDDNFTIPVFSSIFLTHLIRLTHV